LPLVPAGLAATSWLQPEKLTSHATAAALGQPDWAKRVGLAGACAADQHDVALMRQELAASQVAHQGLADRRAIKGEVVFRISNRSIR
jgi:hypothetical protein